MDYVYFAAAHDSNGPPRSLAAQDEGRRPKPGSWVACEQPERKWERGMVGFHDCCPGCLLALLAYEQSGDLAASCHLGPLARELERRLNEWGSAEGAISWFLSSTARSE